MESVTKRLDLGDIDAAQFTKIVDLGCGIPISVLGGVREIMSIGRAADSFQMDLVCEAVEDEILRSTSETRFHRSPKRRDAIRGWECFNCGLEQFMIL